MRRREKKQNHHQSLVAEVLIGDLAIHTEAEALRPIATLGECVFFGVHSIVL